MGDSVGAAVLAESTLRLLRGKKASSSTVL
jgi:hypothetical protein